MRQGLIKGNGRQRIAQDTITNVAYYPPSQKNTAKPPFVLQGAPAEAGNWFEPCSARERFSVGLSCHLCLLYNPNSILGRTRIQSLGPQGKRAKSVTSKRTHVTSERPAGPSATTHIKLRAYFGHLVNGIASGLQGNNGDSVLVRHN